jgi:hypothetical protein
METDTVSDPTVDPEQIAALLDGRLDARARAELLARLAQSEAGLEAYADAAATMRELEETHQLPSPGPATAARHGPTRRWPWLMLAAALILAVGTSRLWRRPSDAALGSPAQLAVLLESGRPAGVPNRVSLAPPAWSTSRGPGGSVTDARALAIRLGARLTDLEVAVRARDTAASSAAADVVRLLGGLRAPSAPLAALYMDVGRRAGGDPDSLAQQLANVWSETARLAGDDDVRLGAWLEAARFAAARHDARFFAAPTSRTAIARLPSIYAARLSTPPHADAEWQDVGRILNDVMSALGR